MLNHEQSSGQTGSAEPAPEVISVQHLHVRYGERVAVDDVPFSVRSGEIFGILG
jgi:ABC-type uncharacterized transport system ATPase subunit